MSGRGSKTSSRPIKKKSKGGRNRRSKREKVIADDELVEVNKVPADQVELGTEQLKEEFTKVLVAADPNAPDNNIVFNNPEACFVNNGIDNSAHTTVHLNLRGKLCHVDSDEYIQQQTEEMDAERQKQQQLTGGDEKAPEEDPQAPARTAAAPLRVKLLKNQFNFSERASQTLNHPARDRETQTIPPPTNNFQSQVDNGVIFDTYLSEMLRKRATKHGSSSKTKTTTSSDPVAVDKTERILASPSLKLACSMMERVVNQNVEQSVYYDFKYYETEDRDAPDGHLLPLWSFKCPETRKKTVTALCWNPKFTDLFAASFGSYDFMRQTKGLVCCYTLKNTGHPEYSFQTESGVMCLDFHPQYPALLAIGMYDGNVAVYDVRAGSDEPIYRSGDPAFSHKDPVWQVRWQTQDMSADLSFYSISSDGRIARWIMTQNEMVCEELLQIKGETAKDTAEDLNLVNSSNGCCFDFHPKSSHQILVGTEEGYLHQCNRAYTAEYTRTYKGHKMAIYTVKWNPFHDRTFLTASDDWTLKMWDANEESPVISYDLKTSVSDVCWAPFNSTLFAACTTDGRIHVFNLLVNKNGPLIHQRVVKKGTLTHIAFASDSPILIVGDDRGSVMCLKLSKKLLAGIDTFDDVDPTAERERLEKVLTITGSNVLDLAQAAS